MATPPFRVALVGAESTGKTTLAASLATAWRARGASVAVVDEVLRRWCQEHGRVPRADEQAGIVAEQARLTEAVAGVDLVIADATPLMVAVYSDLLFDDRSLYAAALAHHRGYGATLLMALDLPWVADGIQRDGPHVRGPVDARVRAALDGAGIAYSVVFGSGDARTRHALAAIDRAMHEPVVGDGGKPWTCEQCSDPDCEHRLFSRLLTSRRY